MLASLRARLLAAVLILSAVGLLLLAAITYAEQRSFLLDRVDQQARSAPPAVVAAELLPHEERRLASLFVDALEEERALLGVGDPAQQQQADRGEGEQADQQPGPQGDHHALLTSGAGAARSPRRARCG